MTIDAPELQNIIVQIEQLPAQSRLKLIQYVAGTLLTHQTQQSRYLTFGEFHGEGMSTEDDFKLVEWHLTDEEVSENEVRS